jgi:aspartyl-tRNA(Asn)/glutamyl-tRNA(Gln) amidotransferase subunit A
MGEARAAEAEIVSGRLRGPLHGVPVDIKDIIDVVGLPTTRHSKILIDNVAAADAVCVSRLQCRRDGARQALHPRICDRRP